MVEVMMVVMVVMIMVVMMMVTQRDCQGARRCDSKADV